MGADSIDPAEDFLDQLAPALDPTVARVPGRATVDSAASSALVLGTVRRQPGASTSQTKS